MDSPISRRQLIQVGGAGTAFTLAGCNALERDDADSVANQDNTPTTHTVTVAVNFDQERISEVEQEVRAQLQRDEITEEEARERLDEVQRDVYSDAVEEFEARSTEIDGASVLDTAPETGIALVEGSGEALITMLGFEEVRGLLKEEQFETLQEGE